MGNGRDPVDSVLLVSHRFALLSGSFWIVLCSCCSSLTLKTRLFGTTGSSNDMAVKICQDPLHTKLSFGVTSTLGRNCVGFFGLSRWCKLGEDPTRLSRH